MAASSIGLGLANIATISGAHADPTFTSSVAGVGADITQSVVDAYGGAEPYPPSTATNFYTPLSSGSASNNVTISSFDAVPQGGTETDPGCITTKVGGPSLDRPNGSSAGITALSDSISGTPWVASSFSCTGTGVNVVGEIDFARSGRGPKTGGSTLTFIPYARDAVAVAYWDHNTGDLATMTSSQLKSLYSSTTGTLTINGDTVEACAVVAGTAVLTNFETAIGVSDANVQRAANAVNCNGIEQNQANAFYSTVSGLPAGTDAVIPFSAANWISQANSLSYDNSNTARTAGVDLSNLDGLGVPYTGTAPNEAPNTTLYQSTQYGVTVYNVVPTTDVSGSTQSAAIKGLFVTSTSAICASSAQSLAHRFGFDSLTAAEGTCGSTTTTGNS